YHFRALQYPYRTPPACFQGMFLVSLPYAVLHGGYWSVIFVVIVAFICCYTGRVLITLPDGVRVRASYREIAEFVFRSPPRRHGGERRPPLRKALMTCILYLVLCGDLMLGCFPRASSASPPGVSFFCLLPCAALTSLRHVSWISFWNTVTHVIINCIIIVYCLTRAAHWQPQKVQFHVDINTFPISVGIIVFSYTSHIFLPTLESNLMDKSRFGLMMNWTHILSAIFKALFGYIGFVTFAEHTKEVITNNLASEPLKVTVNVALVVKALCSYPLPYFAAANFLESSLFSGWPLPSCWNSTGDFKLWALLPRAALVLFTYVIAITVPHFALLCGLIGSFTGTMLSFVWPAYFHFSLKRHSVSCFVLGLDLLIIGNGLAVRLRRDVC
uniref:Aa_trans domain-containing protein n=1 Tax=Macrostomum lignano TaxID=282301 RepID=A0A1I8F5H7_9PLAT